MSEVNREDVLQYIRDNLTIHISRDVPYYSYPEITVTLKLEGCEISSDSCTIYDGEHNG